MYDAQYSDSVIGQSEWNQYLEAANENAPIRRAEKSEALRHVSKAGKGFVDRQGEGFAHVGGFALEPLAEILNIALEVRVELELPYHARPLNFIALSRARMSV